MQNMLGKYIFTTWVHTESGYEQKWLRRVTRQSDKYFYADVQRWSDYKSNAKYKWPKRLAFKGYYDKNGVLIDSMNVGRRCTKEGVATVKVVEDFSELKCKATYQEMFEVDITKHLDEDAIISKILKKRGEDGDTYNEYKPRLTDKDSRMYEILGNLIEHLTELFHVPVYRISSMCSINTTHDITIFSKNGVHYHYTINGNDKEVLTRKENEHNCTITFWLFEDRLVFQLADGIGSW
jgi:hypothetical protein